MKSEKAFRKFLKTRDRASLSWVNGDPSRLLEILPKKGEATFFGPMGGILEGAKKVAARYEGDSAHFAEGSENKIEILQSGVSGEIGFLVALQTTRAQMQGEKKRVTMKIRLTEIYQFRKGQWLLTHRHADTLTEPPGRK